MRIIPGYIFFSLAFLLFKPSEVHAQDYSIGNAAPLFSAHEMLQLTLRADFKTILKDVGDDRNEHTALLEYVEGGDTIVLNIKIMTRGNFRRKAENCVFPPLRLNFKKKQVKGTLFEGLDKVKLVTHCRPNSRAYRQYVIKEYLNYRVYNILTDTSLRARPAIMHYIDEPSGKKSQQSFSFFIESDDAFEDRFEATESDEKYCFQDSTRYDHMSTLAMFQYFIGNTDWAVSTLHNIKLFETDASQPPYAIPYDFDWSGVVSAVYAKPQPRFGLEEVSQRLFRGFCRSRAQFDEQFVFFKSKKNEVFQLYQHFEPLHHKQEKDVIKYYDEFYELIENDAMVKIEFLDRCLKQDKF